MTGALAIRQFIGRQVQGPSASAQITSPDQIAGLLRWYKGDSYVGLMDGASVGVQTTSPWVDSTGSGNNPSHPTSDAIWHDATAYGSPYVFLDLAGLSGVSLATLGDLTIVCASKQHAGGPYAFVCSSASGHLRTDYLGDNVILFYDGTGGGQGSSALGSPDAFGVFTCQRSGTTVSFIENVTARGSFTYSSANFPVDVLGTTGGSKIDMGELLIYNTVVSTASLGQLYTNYFKPRFTILP